MKNNLMYRFFRILMVLVFTAGLVPAVSQVTPVLADSTLHLSVISAADSGNYGITKGDAITSFKYIINIDNTGTTEQRSPAPGTGCSPQDAGYPDTCNWVSIASTASSSPIYTQGNQDDFPGGVFTINGNAVILPTGRYLISVLADNYKIDGAHFTVPVSGNVDVTVEMQPYDLPDATIQAEVFEDMAPTNSAPDVPAERGLAGFVGHINGLHRRSDHRLSTAIRCAATVTASVNAMWSMAASIRARSTQSMLLDAARLLHGDELPANATTVDTHGAIPANAVIEGKVIIPEPRTEPLRPFGCSPEQSGWIQTTTLEGNHDWDAWVMEGATGLDTEFVVAGEPFPATFFGYVQPTNTMGRPAAGDDQGQCAGSQRLYSSSGWHYR